MLEKILQEERSGSTGAEHAPAGEFVSKLRGSVELSLCMLGLVACFLLAAIWVS